MYFISHSKPWVKKPLNWCWKEDYSCFLNMCWMHSHFGKMCRKHSHGESVCEKSDEDVSECTQTHLKINSRRRVQFISGSSAGQIRAATFPTASIVWTQGNIARSLLRPGSRKNLVKCNDFVCTSVRNIFCYFLRIFSLLVPTYSFSNDLMHSTSLIFYFVGRFDVSMNERALIWRYRKTFWRSCNNIWSRFHFYFWKHCMKSKIVRFSFGWPRWTNRREWHKVYAIVSSAILIISEIHPPVIAKWYLKCDDFV